MLSRTEMIAAALILLAGIAIGLAAGFLIWGRQTVTIDEAFAPPIVHDDGSVTAPRVPGEKPRVAPPETPKGRTTRIAEVEVKPDHVLLPERTVGDVTCPPERVECPTIRVRLDTTELADGSHRVSVQADGGEILDAVDIPVGPTIVIGRKPWALGYERMPGGSNGIAVERDIGNLRLGGTMTVQDQPHIGLRVLWKF